MSPATANFSRFDPYSSSELFTYLKASKVPRTMDGSENEAPDPTFSHVPYEQRWEYLKDVIVSLYIGEKMTVQRVADKMATDYKFFAQ